MITYKNDALDLTDTEQNLNDEDKWIEDKDGNIVAHVGKYSSNNVDTIQHLVIKDNTLDGTKKILVGNGHRYLEISKQDIIDFFKEIETLNAFESRDTILIVDSLGGDVGSNADIFSLELKRYEVPDMEQIKQICFQEKKEIRKFKNNNERWKQDRRNQSFKSKLRR